jgi:hypothetical protein
VEKKVETDTESLTGTKDERDKGAAQGPQKGTYAQLPSKTEQSGMCQIQEAYLYSEPCEAAGVRPGQINFIYDSGTVSGVTGEKEINIL